MHAVKRRARPASLVWATMAVALVALVASALLAWRAGRAAYGFLPSLNDDTPVLASLPPVVAEPPRRLARRVVLVIVDGLRLDASYGRPFLDGLRGRGIEGTARSHFPTLSRPNYVSIATGVEPEWSGVRTNDYHSRVKVDSLMARARAAGLRVAHVSQGFTGFPDLFAPDLDEGVAAPWSGGMERSARAVLERPDELVILLPDEVDVAGHRHGGGSPEYRAAARRVDEALGRLLGAVDLTETAIVVVADHGHVDPGGHGGTEPEVAQVPLVLAGAGIRPRAAPLRADLVDVAPTVAALLGIPAPGHALGRTLTEALAVTPAEAAALREADALRHGRLRPVVAQVVETRERGALATRLSRFALVVAALALGLAATLWGGRRGILTLDRRVLVIGITAFPLTFYGLFVATQRFLSPSMLPGTGALVPTIFTYGVAAAVANYLLSLTALAGRPVPRDRLAAAAGLAIVGMLVALAPAGAAWAFGGQALAVDLPAEELLMVPPVTYSAVSCYVLSAAVILATEYVVFLARASDPVRSLRHATAR